MSEKQFEEFDERFRDAAEQYEPPFDEASWKMLEPRLDAPAPGRRRAGWWWVADMLMIGLLLYIALHLASSGGFNTASDDNNPTKAAIHQQQDVVTSPEQMMDETSGETAAAEQSAKLEVAPGTPSATDASSDARKPVPPNNIAGSADQTGNTSAIKKVDVKQQSHQQSIATGNNAIANKSISGSKAASTTGVMVVNDGMNSGNNNVGSPVNGNHAIEPKQMAVDANAAAIDIPNDKLIIGAEMSIEKIDNADLAVKQPPKETPTIAADAATPDIRKRINPASGFYVYGMAGSEWSLVPGNDAGKATFAWGLGLGYRFSPKWALQAGYFRTRKLYDAGPGDYKPKPGTYYYNLTIKHVEADCEIAEIPIAVSYSLLNTRKQSLFATLGLSSYIMNSEEYHYDYIRANQMPGYAKYRYETHDSHLFAGLLISGGYSYTLFNGFSLSAEPYFKIPLYGVGEGSIKIYNFGLMAGARYTLPSFRKK